MNKWFHILFVAAVMAIAVGCSKDKGGGGTRAYVPGHCFNGAYGNHHDPNCNFFGGNPYWQGPVGSAQNICSVYDTPYERFAPVFYPNLGITVCAGFSTFAFYGNPMFYMGNNNVYQGCVPGAINNCNCRTFGNTHGWHAQFGVCF